MAHLKKIERRSVKMWATNEALSAVPVGEKRTQMANEHTEDLKWMLEQESAIVGRFKKYLDVR